MTFFHLNMGHLLVHSADMEKSQDFLDNLED